jgi:hypothetical protein
LSEAESTAFIEDESLIVEEKLDGTNVGIHFDSNSQMVLQCRGHLITEGMQPLPPPRCGLLPLRGLLLGLPTFDYCCTHKKNLPD